MEVITSIKEMTEKQIRHIQFENNGKAYNTSNYGEQSYEISVRLIDLFLEAYMTRRIYIDISNYNPFDEKFFNENAKELIEKMGYIHYKMGESKSIYNYCLTNKLYKYIFQSDTFENWFYEHVYNHAKDNDDLYEDIEKCLNDIINNWNKKSATIYGDSYSLAHYSLLQKKFEIFKSFKSYVYYNFPEDELVDYYDDLYTIYNYIPLYLRNKQTYFDYILSKERPDLLCQFDSKFITDEIYHKYENSFQSVILKNDFIPSAFKKSEKIREFLFKNKEFKKILMMDIPPLLSYFDNDEFYNYFVHKYDIGVSKNIPEIFEYFLDKGEYVFVYNNFDVSLFTIDILDKHPEIFTNEFSSYFKLKISFGLDVLEHFLKKEDILHTPIDYFTDTAIDEAIEKYPDKMLPLILENISKFKNNYTALTLVLEKKRIDFSLRFSPDLFNQNLLNIYGRDILDYLEKEELNNYFPFRKNEDMFNYCLTNKRYKLLKGFDNKFFTDEVINNYARDILISFGDEFPLGFKNDKMFKKSIEYGFYNLAATYDDITDSDIDKYFPELLKGINSPYAYKLRNNSYFIKKCLDEDIPNLFELLNYSKITDEIIASHKEKVVELLSGNQEKLGLLSSPATFRFLIDNKLYHLLDRLTYSAYDEEYVKKYINLIDELAIVNLPEYLKNSVVYLKHCIDIGKKEYIMEFYFAYEKLDKEYIKKLSSFLSIPFSNYVASSRNILEYFLENNDLTYINEFRSLCFEDVYDMITNFSDDEKKGSNLLNKYIDLLCDYSIEHGIPKPLKENFSFLLKILELEKYELLEQFEPLAFPSFYSSRDENYKKIIKYIEEYKKGVVPLNLITNESLRKIVFEQHKEDLLLQFVLNANSEEMLKRYAKKLNIEYNEFKKKIIYLISRNDELFNTVLPKMFDKKMSIISFRHLEKIMLYPDLQFKLINMTNDELKVMAKVFDILDNDNYDYSGVVVSIINNLPKYNNLIKNIDFSQLSKEEINRLLIVLSRKDNLYGISSIEDLNIKEYKNKKKQYFSKITNKIKNGNISLDELKAALLEKKFGLSIDQTSFLVERYCHSLDSLEKGNFDYKKYTILKEIDRIYKCNDLTILKYLYIKSDTIIVDLETSVSLESSIRQEFAKMYSDSLYKLKSEHKIENNSSLKNDNNKVYNILSNLNYKGKKIPVYIMDGDFRLQIHALGAYRNWERPENFKRDWERPKIAYHGICTSYIANNQIANARANHPILGFDNYSSNSLLCAGNYDLFSDYALSRYDSSYYLPYKFFLPDDMINNTRHTHNEMVIERRSNTNTTYKRLPNYIVMLVDDINNLQNYNNNLWDEYCQAAHDYDVPIVIVDRLKYAKHERNKIAELEKEFNSTYNENILEKIILEFCNNMIGCACYDQNNICEYNKIFSLKSFSDLVSNIINSILKIPEEKQKLKLIKSLYTYLYNEKSKGSSIPSIEGLTKILEKAGVSLKTEDKVVYSSENERIINEYYYNASVEIQSLIEEDINNNVDLKEIVNNIKSGSYERRHRK